MVQRLGKTEVVEPCTGMWLVGKRIKGRGKDEDSGNRHGNVGNSKQQGCDED